MGSYSTGTDTRSDEPKIEPFRPNQHGVLRGRSFAVHPTRAISDPHKPKG